MIVMLNRLLTSALILLSFNLQAQEFSADSVINSPISKAIGIYNQSIAGQSEIYNGTAYEPPPKAYKGSVYFQDRNYFSPCIIRYNGTLYNNIPVLYDVFNDLMIASSPDQFNYILRTGKLSDVLMLNHHFIYFNNDSSNVLRSGFYDQLYARKAAVLVKRVKLVSNNITQQGVEIAYKDNSEIYVKKSGNYYQVDSKTALMNVLKDKEKELDQYLKTKKLKFNKDKEASIVALVQYYDQITN